VRLTNARIIIIIIIIIIEMSFREYTSAKSKPTNELENLLPAEIVKYFCYY